MLAVEFQGPYNCGASIRKRHAVAPSVCRGRELRARLIPLNQGRCMRRNVLGLGLVALLAEVAGGQGLRQKLELGLFSFGDCGEPLCLPVLVLQRQRARTPLHSFRRSGERGHHLVSRQRRGVERQQHSDQRDDEWRDVQLLRRRAGADECVGRADLRRAGANPRPRSNVDRSERDVDPIQHSSRNTAELARLQLHTPGYPSSGPGKSAAARTSSSRCGRRST